MKSETNADAVGIDAAKWVQVQPFDEHNQRLLSNTHPLDWKNPTPSGRYNLVVVGGGTAGLVAAAGAAGLGAKVALIERRLLGGDCLNVGCVPSKALIRSARVLGEISQAGKFGVQTPAAASSDFQATMERMRRLRADISPQDSAARFRELGVDVYLGDAKFVGEDAVEAGGRTLRFARACVATGSRPAAPSIPNLEEVGFLTNESVFGLTELPPRLAVVGAGPIGCELAQTFARFGSKVYLIEARHGVLPNDDGQAAEIVRRAIAADGVELMCCGENLHVQRGDNGKRLTVDSHGRRQDLCVDEILVAVGRAPNVDDLGLEQAGVACDKTGVQVDDFLRTTNPRIYAAGDVCSRYRFTHAADAMSRIVIQNALFFGRKRVSKLTIPWCIYTDPEVAHVGVLPADAEERDVPIDTFTIHQSDVDRAILDGETEGFLKIHLRRGSDEILGATLVARHAGEIISELTLAMTAGVGLGKIATVVHPYPTQAEMIKKAADAYNRARLTPRVQRLLAAFLRWRR